MCSLFCAVRLSADGSHDATWLVIWIDDVPPTLSVADLGYAGWSSFEKPSSVAFALPFSTYHSLTFILLLLTLTSSSSNTHQHTHLSIFSLNIDRVNRGAAASEHPPLRGSESTTRKLQKNGGGAVLKSWSCEAVGAGTFPTCPNAGKQYIENQKGPGEECMPCCECDCDTTVATVCRTKVVVDDGDDCSAYGSQFVEYDGTGGDCESTCGDHCNPVWTGGDNGGFDQEEIMYLCVKC